MTQAGIWIDKQQALIVELEQGNERIRKVDSDLEFYNPKGGSRSKTRWGPQQVVHDSTYMEREKHQLRRYFEALAEALGTPQAVALFGPAETKSQFRKYLDENQPELAARVKGVGTADSMTENQVKALVRDFFNDQH